MCTLIGISQIQGQVEEHSKVKEIAKEEAGREVRCAEALQQLCQTNANITQLAVDPAQCTVRGDGVKTAEVHQTTEVTLTAKAIISNIRDSAVVVWPVKSLYGGSFVKCDVDQSGPGE